MPQVNLSTSTKHSELCIRPVANSPTRGRRKKQGSASRRPVRVRAERADLVGVGFCVRSHQSCVAISLNV